MPAVIAITNVNILESLDNFKLYKGTIRISEGKIIEVCDSPHKDDVILEMSDRIVMPGLVVGHHHLYSSLARGMPAPKNNPKNFVEVLQYVWWVLDRALDEETIRMSGYAGVLGAARLGITGIIDHHASPNYIDGSLDILSEAFKSIGLRGILTYEVTDRGGKDRAQAGIKENVRFIKEHKNDPMIKGMMGGHASFTIDDDTFDKIAAYCKDLDVGLHIHVLEDAADCSASKEKYGEDPISRLKKRELLRDDSILVHLVHATPEEISLSEESSILVHNPRSNMNNRVGYAKVKPSWTIGTDGIDSNILEEAKAAFYLSRHEKHGFDYALPLSLLSNAQKVFGKLMNLKLGKIAAGYEADLTFLRYNPPTILSGNNFIGHLIFGLGSWAISETMVNGKFVYKSGIVQGIDEKEIFSKSQAASKKLWDKMEEIQ